MKVIQVTRVLSSMGGIETFVDRSSNALVDSGHKAIVITAEDVPSEGRYDVVSTAAKDRIFPTFSFEDQVTSIVKSESPDVVVVHHIGDPSLTRGLAHFAPVAEFVHGFLCLGGKLFRRTNEHCEHRIGMRCLVDWYVGPCGSSPRPSTAWHGLTSARRHLDSVNASDSVFVPSRFIRDYLANEGVDPSRILIIDLTNGLVKSGQLRDDENRSIDQVDILFPGRLTYEKGVQDVIRALTRLPSNYVLWIAGEGWYRSELERLVTRLRLRNRVHFLGRLHSKDLEELYRKSHVVVVPSLWPEPGGTVVAEAWARDIPVVVYDSGSLAEWSRLAGVFVAERGDIGALAKELENAPFAFELFTAPVDEPHSYISFIEALTSLKVSRTSR